MAHLTKLSPDRQFGLLLALALGGFGIRGLTQGNNRTSSAILVAVGVAVGLIALTVPRILTPFTKAWIFFGEMLGRVISPVMLAVIFFGILTPIALVGRLLGRDELSLKRRRVETYWIHRNPSGSESQSFKNQF
jgi:hypothetical protein